MWWAALVFTVVSVWLAPSVGASSAAWVGGAAGLVTLWVDIQLHPWTRCWACGGDSRVRDQKGTSWRFCRICGGTGQRRRLLARRVRGA